MNKWDKFESALMKTVECCLQSTGSDAYRKVIAHSKQKRTEQVMTKAVMKNAEAKHRHFQKESPYPCLAWGNASLFAE